jgi:hypothetical protein
VGTEGVVFAARLVPGKSEVAAPAMTERWTNLRLLNFG